MPSNGARPSSYVQRHSRNVPGVNRHNRMNPTRPMYRHRMRMVTQRRPDDIDHENRSAKAPSSKTAVRRGHPAPAKPTPKRPVPTAKRSPPPPIPRSPHIPGPRGPHPISKAIRIKTGIGRHSRLPDLTLPRNVIPTPIGIQIRPSIPLVTSEVVPRGSPVRSLIRRRLIALLVPTIPGIGQ